MQAGNYQAHKKDLQHLTFCSRTDSMKTNKDRDRHYKTAPCRQALLILGKTQSDISRETGLHRVIISKFFTGKSVRADTALKIVDALHLKIEDVIIKRSPVMPDMKRKRKVTAAA